MGLLNHQGLPIVTGPAWAGVRYFTTTRHAHHATAIDQHTRPLNTCTTPYGCFNLGDHVGDDDRIVRTNRQRLADTLPCAPIWMEQVHGTDVLDADRYPLAVVPAISPVADAVITSQPDRVLCVMTADCLPVVVSNDSASVLGLAHAGWRGLAAGVLENMFALLQRKTNEQKPTWRAWIGPAISQSAFEVGDEVRAAFVDFDSSASDSFTAGARAGKWQADLAGLAARRLHHMGVARVDLARMCTHSEGDAFYSYRRDGKTGRMATVAWLNASDLP